MLDVSCFPMSRKGFPALSCRAFICRRFAAGTRFVPLCMLGGEFRNLFYWAPRLFAGLHQPFIASATTLAKSLTSSSVVSNEHIQRTIHSSSIQG